MARLITDVTQEMLWERLTGCSLPPEGSEFTNTTVRAMFMRRREDGAAQMIALYRGHGLHVSEWTMPPASLLAKEAANAA